MNKTKLKDFAIYSRNKLIEDVKLNLSKLGIKENGEIEEPVSELVNLISFKSGEKIYNEDVKKYRRLVEEIEKRAKETDKKIAYETLVEEVAYTWFNRIIAIRFMEVNRYMPDKMRILSSGIEGVKEPEFVTNYRSTNIGIKEEEFEELDELKLDGSAKSMDQIFQSMFIKQCSNLNQLLPELFEEIDDYKELLLNISYIDETGVIYKLIEEIDESDFNIEKSGQIEIIGWMYQYYNSEIKKQVNNSKNKIDKDTLPAVTQLFTPNWIVKYMVENSLGRLLIERKIAKGSEKTEKDLAKESGYIYYLEEAKQIESVEISLKDIRKSRKDLELEDIKFIDPSMGSGHILVYAFEVFLKAYLEEGYTEREAAESIIKNNLYGLDIDKRAYQLAYFALMMKGRQYSRRILEKNLENKLNYFIDSKDINKKQLDYLGYEIENKEKLRIEILEILEIFKNARELGSILKIEKKYNYKKLYEFIEKINIKELPMNLVGIEKTQKQLNQILRLSEILYDNYHIVVTNPPYLGRKNMSANITNYLDTMYPNTKSDLFAVFMDKSEELLINDGYYGMINMHSWMFLSSYENKRFNILNNYKIINMLHLGARAFKEISGEVVQTTAFIIKKNNLNNYVGKYLRLIDFSSAEEKEEKTLEAIENPNCGYYYETNEENFKKIPGSPIAYWASDNIINKFDYKSIDNYATVITGMTIGNNKKYLRIWYEVNVNKINFYCKTMENINLKFKNWIPYSKGGQRRQWYGNYDYIVNWSQNKKFNRAKTTLKQLYLRKAITWPFITLGKFSARILPEGFLWDVAGSPCFFENDVEEKYILGFMTSVVCDYILNIINPTINVQAIDISNLPLLKDSLYEEQIINFVEESIQFSKQDWDMYEISWDFEKSPLLDESKISKTNSIKKAYEEYKNYVNLNFEKLKENEERLNEIFISIYGLEDEITPEVFDRDITITKIFDNKKDIDEEIKGNKYVKTREDIVKDFISYGIGCIFGRYSLDEKGIIFAGGDFDISRYESFIPVEKNVAIITDREYLKEDIVSNFVDFLKVAFGEEYLEENLDFIASELKGKGTSREKIRNYFINDFYKDHVKKYQKTPIYWMYDSGANKTNSQRKNAFKSLIYMHRYNRDTTGSVRIDYLHELQRLYDRRIDFLKGEILATRDKKIIASFEKELEDIKQKAKECKDYDESIGHMALERIDIDLDNGVKVNYKKIQRDKNEIEYKILAKL